VSADTLYEHAGVAPESDAESAVLQAIREDARLTGRQRQALTQVYEAFVATGPQPARSRRPVADDPVADDPTDPGVGIDGG
jgi:hypothetical protein